MEHEGPSVGSTLLLDRWALWAKWSRGHGIGHYHPILCHLIDVAMAAEALWRTTLPPRWKDGFARAIGLSEAEAERCVVYWAGLHDLGKVSPGFQLQLQQTNREAHALIVERLRAAGLPWGQVDWIAHGAVSAKALRKILPEHFGYTTGVADAVAVAIGGHHGRFQTYGELRKLHTEGVGEGRWHDARLAHAQWLAQALDGPVVPAAVTLSHAVSMMLAGFVSVADWIGSTDFFEHAAPDARVIPTLELISYRDHARAQANKALEALGWVGWTPSPQRLAFTQLFSIGEPRLLQVATIELAERLAGPALVVIESPMGEGKTEAAMYLADHWGTTLGQRGMYFALPTQATSDGMFERVTTFLRSRYPHDVVNVQLLHGHAALSETLKDLQANWRGLLHPEGIYAGENPGDTRHGDVVAAEWFSDAKRSLLAPFGVGTVDQALLAVLQIMHVFVRQFGLSTKSIIIDEVHAYDLYMSTLLKRLLEWLGALQAPVVLLSATLPRQRRRELLGAYARGAGWEDMPDDDGTRYPRVTWVTANDRGARQTAVSALNQREAEIEWLSAEIPEPEGAREARAFPLGLKLQDLLRNGGCAAVICNTVGRAQQMYQALKPFFSASASDGLPELDLLHARYPQEMRVKRERRSLARFGKAGDGVVRPNRAVLVATQVIEQSLDLDFDVMVTDLAPADLVLQRMGRLHRHERIRPATLDRARLLLLGPGLNDEGTPQFDHGSLAVYDGHILLRSYLALRGRATLRLPEDIEPLVETVYDDARACPADVSLAIRQWWDASRRLLDQMRAQEEQAAVNRYIKHPTFGDELAKVVGELRSEDEPELHPALQALTRLAEPTVTVACLAGTAEQPRLRPGGAAVSLLGKPSRAEIEALLRRSVSLTDKRVVHLLLNQAPPPGWEETPLLRRHRALILDERGSVAVGKWHLRLDRELGIVIE